MTAFFTTEGTEGTEKKLRIHHKEDEGTEEEIVFSVPSVPSVVNKKSRREGLHGSR